MASNIVAVSSGPDSVKALQDVAFNATLDLARIRALADLATWIERARHVCEGVDALSYHDAQAAERLRQADIRAAAGFWDQSESSGLEHLLMYLSELASDQECRLQQAITASRVPASHVAHASKPEQTHG